MGGDGVKQDILTKRLVARCLSSYSIYLTYLVDHLPTIKIFGAAKKCHGRTNVISFCVVCS